MKCLRNKFEIKDENDEGYSQLEKSHAKEVEDTEVVKEDNEFKNECSEMVEREKLLTIVVR